MTWLAQGGSIPPSRHRATAIDRTIYPHNYGEYSGFAKSLGNSLRSVIAICDDHSWHRFSGRFYMADNLLTIPNEAGKRILAQGGIVARPLLRTNQFLKYCKDRGLSLNRERLLRLERLKLFAPLFRVHTPEQEVARMSIPLRENDQWFKRGWAWDTSGMDFNYNVPDKTDQNVEAYYSVFQIYHLEAVVNDMTLSVQLDSFLEPSSNKPVDWIKNGQSWLSYGREASQTLQTHRHRPAVALLCQFVSDRYYPLARTDQRTINIPRRHASFDQWTQTLLTDWNWYKLKQGWDATVTASLFGLTPKKLRHAYEELAASQSFCDPIESWYQLVQFISVRELDKLKGDALRAATIRSGAIMLKLLYQDLYGEELPHPNEARGQINNHFPELEVRRDTRRYLEFVVNRYGLNPQPKLTLFVEGLSEETAIRLIFDKYFGADPGKYGIEILSLGSVDNATGGKEDKFRAILRLIDYLHHHQTFSFLILDNENYAKKLKNQAQKAKSIHHKRRFATRSEYIRIWKHSFEFDNFSATEIATAFNELCGNRVRFKRNEIAACKREKNPGAALAALYKNKTQYGLKKPKLAEILVERMFSPNTKRRVENRPIIKVLERVTTLAARNPFATTQDIWERNQASKYLGKKRSA